MRNRERRVVKEKENEEEGNKRVKNKERRIVGEKKKK